jgi:hypothetical protein
MPELRQLTPRAMGRMDLYLFQLSIADRIT